MKRFLRNVLATITGILVSGFILLILGIITVTGLITATEAETTVHKNSIFLLELKGNITERYQQNPIDRILGEEKTTCGN